VDDTIETRPSSRGLQFEFGRSALCPQTHDARKHFIDIVRFSASKKDMFINYVSGCTKQFSPAQIFNRLKY